MENTKVSFPSAKLIIHMWNQNWKICSLSKNVKFPTNSSGFNYITNPGFPDWKQLYVIDPLLVLKEKKLSSMHPGNGCLLFLPVLSQNSTEVFLCNLCNKLNHTRGYSSVI